MPVYVVKQPHLAAMLAILKQNSRTAKKSDNAMRHNLDGVFAVQAL